MCFQKHILICEKSLEQTKNTMEQYQNSNLLICNKCLKIYKSNLCFKRHLDTECGSKNRNHFQCEHCKASFSWKFNLERHLIKNTCNKKVDLEPCFVPSCKVNTRKKVHLINHLLEAHTNEPTYEGSMQCWKDVSIYELKFKCLSDFQLWFNKECDKTGAYFSSGGRHCKNETTYITYHCQFDKEIKKNFTPKSNKQYSYKTSNLNCPARICARFNTRDKSDVTALYYVAHNHPMLSSVETHFIQFQAEQGLNTFQILKQLRDGVDILEENIRRTLKNELVTARQIDQVILSHKASQNATENVCKDNEMHSSQSPYEHQYVTEDIIVREEPIEQEDIENSQVVIVLEGDPMEMTDTEQSETTKPILDAIQAKTERLLELLNYDTDMSSLKFIEEQLELWLERYGQRSRSDSLTKDVTEETIELLNSIKDKCNILLVHLFAQETDTSFLTDIEVQLEIWMQQCT